MKKIVRISNMLLGKKVEYLYDGIVFSAKPTIKRVTNYLLSRIEHKLRINKPYSYPVGLQLEPTTNCQLSCPLCPRQKDVRLNGPRDMEWDNYEKLMSEIGPYLTHIAFWQWGEPLLHPKISRMIKLAHDYGIITAISTNAQTDLSENDISKLIKSGLDMIIISMDGVSEKTYKKFRNGGNVEKVKNFTKKIAKAKKDLHSKTPLVNVRCIATRHNEGEIEKVKNFATNAGADIFSIKGVSLYHDASPENPDLPENKAYRTYQYRGKHEAEQYRKMPNYCCKPWAYPTLRNNGNLLMCECDHHMEQLVGNVFKESSFRKVWQNKKAQEIRRKFSRSGKIDLSFCRRCRYKIDDAMREVENLKKEIE